jgi:light-harvesting complex I chlorophyll a/b binding protein 1
VLQWGTLPTILAIKFVVIAFTEHQRTMEKGPEKKYPGSAFDSLRFSRTRSSSRSTSNEIKNGDMLVLMSSLLLISSYIYIYPN